MNIPKISFMISSNTFLLLPVIFSFIYGYWLYFFFASGICLFSFLYHIYRLKKPNSLYFSIFRTLDWLFAVGSFFYMYYFTYTVVSSEFTTMLFIMLSVVILFFLYGWKYGDYHKQHPWFHVIASLVSALILILT